jgi:hypothetical protein
MAQRSCPAACPAGDGSLPHPCIGRARRMMVPSRPEQHAVLIEAVQNHMPDVLVVDEIGSAAEVGARGGGVEGRQPALPCLLPPWLPMHVAPGHIVRRSQAATAAGP